MWFDLFVKISLGIQGIQVFIKYSTWDFCMLAVTKQQLRCFNLACPALASLKKELSNLTWHNPPWTLPSLCTVPVHLGCSSTASRDLFCLSHSDSLVWTFPTERQLETQRVSSVRLELVVWSFSTFYNNSLIHILYLLLTATPLPLWKYNLS